MVGTGRGWTQLLKHVLSSWTRTFSSALPELLAPPFGHVAVSLPPLSLQLALREQVNGCVSRMRVQAGCDHPQSSRLLSGNVHECPDNHPFTFPALPPLPTEPSLPTPGRTPTRIPTRVPVPALSTCCVPLPAGPPTPARLSRKTRCPLSNVNTCFRVVRVVRASHRA